jgi:hypothetical protein
MIIALIWFWRRKIDPVANRPRWIVVGAGLFVLVGIPGGLWIFVAMQSYMVAGMAMSAIAAPVITAVGILVPFYCVSGLKWLFSR